MAVVVVVGAGFGDEGKGSVTDFLTRKHKAGTVVRFNGGPQAGHNVLTSNGKHHVFSQFGSGTFAGARTHLNRFMLVNPVTMLTEGAHLLELGINDAFERVTVDEEALVITPYHVALNRIEELCRNSRHGSCGMGIGVTVADSLARPEQAIRFKDLDPGSVKALDEKLQGIQERLFRVALFTTSGIPQSPLLKKEMDCLTLPSAVIMERFRALKKTGVRSVGEEYLGSILQSGNVIFEGAQGALLDEKYGFHPHTTRSDCTFGNARTLLKGYDVDVTNLAVLRAYHTRHGAGPFPTEYEDGPNDPRNPPNSWQKNFRVGFFDRVLAQYAQEILQDIDAVALCHMDQVRWPNSICYSYRCPDNNILRKIPLVTRDEYELQLTDHAAKGAAYRHPLFDVVPKYKDIDRLEEFLYIISDTMKAPVTILSRGPTAEDKVCLT